MGTIDGLGIHCFGASGRIAGVFARIRGRAYVIGAMQRGIFWRFGAAIHNPYPGYWDSVFGIRTELGPIALALKVGMKDEIIPVRFRPYWVHGSFHFSRTGCISFIFTALDPERFPKIERKNWEIFSEYPMEEDESYFSDGKERY